MELFSEGELVIKSYVCDELEIGMLFVNKISVGVIDEYIEIWSLKEIPLDMNEFLAKNGAPIDLMVIDDEDSLIAIGEQLNTLCYKDELLDLDLTHINTIFREYEGYLEFAINAHFYINHGIKIIEIFDDGIIIQYPEM